MPAQAEITDHPALRIRVTKLFWMKRIYDWAVTHHNSPSFFDRALMLSCLDELVENRFNTIYFWNGHFGMDGPASDAGGRFSLASGAFADGGGVVSAGLSFQVRRTPSRTETRG